MEELTLKNDNVKKYIDLLISAERLLVMHFNDEKVISTGRVSFEDKQSEMIGKSLQGGVHRLFFSIFEDYKTGIYLNDKFFRYIMLNELQCISCEEEKI